MCSAIWLPLEKDERYEPVLQGAVTMSNIYFLDNFPTLFYIPTAANLVIFCILYVCSLFGSAAFENIF